MKYISTIFESHFLGYFNWIKEITHLIYPSSHLVLPHVQSQKTKGLIIPAQFKERHLKLLTILLKYFLISTLEKKSLHYFNTCFYSKFTEQLNILQPRPAIKGAVKSYTSILCVENKSRTPFPSRTAIYQAFPSVKLTVTAQKPHPHSQTDIPAPTPKRMMIIQVTPSLKQAIFFC